MHSNTEEFARAIRKRNRQHALVVFPSSHVYLTDEDIDAESGISLTEMFNAEDEMTMGRAVSAEISLGLISRDGMSEIDFTDEFAVHLGVERGEKQSYADISQVASGATLVLIADLDGTPAIISTNPAWASLTCNGVSYVLSGNPRALLCEEDVLYVVGDGGVLLNTFTISNGALSANTNDDVGTLMQGKMAAWALDGACITLSDGVARRFELETASGVWDDLSDKTWGSLSNRTWDDAVSADPVIAYSETIYVPLGMFIGERPDKVLTQTISLLGHDRMTRFDVDATGFLQSLTSPMTLQAMFEVVCAWCGVEHSYANGRTFINGSKTFTSPPQRADGSMTCRDVLRWIAEASCAYARMTRTGECELAWFTETGYECAKTDRFALDIAEYEVPVPDKLCVHVTEADVGVILPQTDTFTGDGSTKVFHLVDESVNAPSVRINNTPNYAFTFNRTARTITFATAPANGAAIVVTPGETNTNAYSIVDNPYLYGMSDAEVRSYARNIYEHLINQSPVHSPMTVEAECNWAVQAGDIILVEDDDGVMRRMPVYAQTIRWNGHAEVSYESTGSRRRGVMSASNRERLASGYSKMEIIKSIEGLTSEVYTYNPETGERISRFSQLAGEMDMMVKSDEIIAQINLSKEGVKIKAPKLTLEGLVTANSYFKINTDGSMEAVNGKFSGTVKSGNWTFDENGSRYSDGSVNVNMSILTGNFVGQGSSSVRAFYGSSNCDVQYGSDYRYTTFIRSGDIQFIIQDSSDISDWVSARFKRSNSGQICFVCGESEGASNTDTASSGNLGYSDQYWDYTFTRVLRAGTYPGSSSRAIKQDIELLPEMGDILDKIEPVRFAYKNAPDTPRYGFIYEDMLELMPVVCFDDGMGDPGIVYTDMIAPMLREIQSLRRRVATLESGG